MPLVDRLLLLAAVGAVAAAAQRLAAAQVAFLDVNFLLVAWASWRMGRRDGVLTAVVAAALVAWSALANPLLFAQPGAEWWVRWTDLVLWAGFLFLAAVAFSALAARDARHIEQVRAVYTGVLQIMAKFIDSIDRSTDNHSRRVAERSLEVGRALGMGEAALETLRVAAYLHDIGKVEVSTSVLRKAAALTEAERAEMERHVEHGSEMLRKLGGLLADVVPLVLYHHERWDGRGYKRLVGDAIPLGARIIAVCDTYDAIVADRPYHKGATHEQAVRIVREERGTQFDPAVVDAFLSIYDAAGAAGRTEEAAAA